MKLHPEVLPGEQLEVLVASAQVTRKWGAYLAGGASLALQLGHRRSVDLDWFTTATVEPEKLRADLESLGLPVEVKQNEEGTFLGNVGRVQYSVFRYRYPLVGRPLDFKGCQLAPLRDIAAMKMTAIVQRSTRRDYVDLHAILVNARVPIRDVVRTMKEKYPGLDPAVALRSLSYFKDVEAQPMPEMVAKTSWAEIKRGLASIAG